MHLPAVKRQLVAWCRYRRQLPLVIVELFGGVLLAVVSDCHDASRARSIASAISYARLANNSGLWHGSAIACRAFAAK